MRKGIDICLASVVLAELGPFVGPCVELPQIVCPLTPIYTSVSSENNHHPSLRLRPVIVGINRRNRIILGTRSQEPCGGLVPSFDLSVTINQRHELSSSSNVTHMYLPSFPSRTATPCRIPIDRPKHGMNRAVSSQMSDPRALRRPPSLGSHPHSSRRKQRGDGRVLKEIPPSSVCNPESNRPRRTLPRPTPKRH